MAAADIRPDDTRAGWFLAGLVEGWGRGYAAAERDAAEAWQHMAAEVPAAASMPTCHRLLAARVAATLAGARPVPSYAECSRSWQGGTA